MPAPAGEEELCPRRLSNNYTSRRRSLADPQDNMFRWIFRLVLITLAGKLISRVVGGQRGTARPAQRRV